MDYTVPKNACELITVPFTSSYDRYAYFGSGDYIGNASGSSREKCSYGGSWIEALKLLYAFLRIDESFANHCYANPVSRDENLEVMFHDANNSIGGHVYWNDTENGVFIFPICPSHNSSTYDKHCFQLTELLRIEPYKSLPAMKLKYTLHYRNKRIEQHATERMPPSL